MTSGSNSSASLLPVGSMPPFASRHARLTQQGQEYFLEDLGSTNGTYLDRARVTTPTPVPVGVPIRIGRTVIELRP